MKRKWCFLVLLVVMLASCQEGKQSNSSEITVYSPYPKGLIQPVLKEFEQQENVKVNIRHGSTQVLLSELHRTSKKERGDVFIGGVLSEVIENTDDFVPYRSPDKDKFRDVAIQSNIVTSFMLMPAVIVVNTDVQGDIVIRGYKDLLQHDLKNKVAYPNPHTTTTGYQHMRAIFSMSNDVQDVYRFDNLAIQLSKSSQVIKEVSEGKYYAGLSYEQDARTAIKKGYPLKIIYPAEGTMLNIDGIALVNTEDPHPKREALMRYLTSYKVQQRLAKEFGVKPIRKDVDETETEETKQLSDIPIIPKSTLPKMSHKIFLENIE